MFGEWAFKTRFVAPPINVPVAGCSPSNQKNVQPRSGKANWPFGQNVGWTDIKNPQTVPASSLRPERNARARFQTEGINFAAAAKAFQALCAARFG